MSEPIVCPRCSTSINTATALPSGMAMKCPCCKQGIRILRNTFGKLESLPVVGDRIDRSVPLPRATRRAEPPSHPSYVPFYESRKTIATLCIMAIGAITCLFVNWYVETVKSLSRTTDRAAMARLARVKQLPVEKKNKDGEIHTNIEPAPPISVRVMSPVIEPAPPTSVRVMAPAAGRVGDLVVGVESASIGPVFIQKRETSDHYLTLNLRITNLSRATVRFPGWQRAASLILLKETSQLYYNRIRFADGNYPDGCLEEVVIEPGQTIKDALVYEPPNGFRNLELDIPYADQGYSFTIPAGMIAKVLTLDLKRPVEAATPPPQSVVPLPPERDPNVRRTIIQEYRRLWAPVERSAKNMVYDHSKQYRRQQHARILKFISKEHEIPESAVQSILTLGR